jgi:hypothetical protein
VPITPCQSRVLLKEGEVSLLIEERIAYIIRAKEVSRRAKNRSASQSELLKSQIASKRECRLKEWLGHQGSKPGEESLLKGNLLAPFR